MEGFSTGNGRYLTRNLGVQFSEGQFSELNGKTVLEWFQVGSDFEDRDENDPINGSQCRAANHFHNPLKPWDEAEMSDGRLSLRGSLVNWRCEREGWEYANRRSNLTWATGFIQPSPEGDKQQSERQEWNWSRARESYEQALVSPLREDQDTGFAETFRALGHVIHLVQDGAQPAHVRNDFESHLEWTNLNPSKSIMDWFGSHYEHYVASHTKQLVQAAVPIKPEFENPSLTDFWDTDIYVGDNPSTSLSQGITEIVNANYFSAKTFPRKTWPTRHPAWPLPIPSYDEEDFHSFPNPTLTNENSRVCSAPFYGDRPETVRRYIVRKGEDDCTQDNYIASAEVQATPSFTNAPTSMQVGDIADLEFQLDFKTYQAYAEKLLPLAIGYSSALIDYFFRGELGVIHHPDGLIIKNNSEEDMASYTDEEGTEIGKISIFYDDLNQHRKLLAEYDLDSAISPGNRSRILEFVKPQDNITPARYIVAFKGRLGKEEGAVIGKVVAPRIYYVSQRVDAESGASYDKIMRMETDGSHKTVIYDNQNTGFLIGKMDISPDSSQLVFQAQQGIGTESKLYILDIANHRGQDDPEPVLLTPGVWPSWSPAGDSIVFQRGTLVRPGYENGTGYLYRYDVEGKTVSQLTSGERSDIHPAWSPDGSRIAYVTNAAGEVDSEPQAGQMHCGNRLISLEYLTETGSYGGSISYCLRDFPIQDSEGDPFSISNEPSSPVWNPDGTEVMYLTEYWYSAHNHVFSRQPFKINIVANSGDPAQNQIETALYDVTNAVNIPYLGVSSWSFAGDEIATTYYHYDDDYSNTDIRLLDSVNGGFMENLTSNSGVNDSYPVYGY